MYNALISKGRHSQMHNLDLWFPEWVILLPWGAVGLLRGCCKQGGGRGVLEVSHVECIDCLFTIDQAAAWSETPSSLSKLFASVTFVCIYHSEVSQVMGLPFIGNVY